MPIRPIPGAVRHAGTYHLATGEWTRSQHTYGILVQDALYRNDLGSNYFGLLDQSEVTHHSARLPGDGQPLRQGGFTFGTADTYVVSGFQFGYCALDSNPVAYSLGFLNSYTPCSNPAGIALVASFTTTGLPNNGCWTIALDLTGTTLLFALDAEGGDGSWDNNDALDSFALVTNVDGGQGDGIGQLTHGPILAGNVFNQPSIGDGTLFQNPGNLGTGLGTSNFFWLASPTVADGCYIYSLSAHFETVLYGNVFEDPPTQFCSPAPANSVSPTGGDLASVSGFGSSVATFRVRDVPAQPGLLMTGPNQTQIPFGCGERCVVGPGVLRYGPFNTGPSASQAFDLSIDMSLSGNSKVQYWYRDPINAQICNASFNLSNGVGL